MRIIAHRGGPEGKLPENSLRAMERAIRLGVDGIEFDVRYHRGRWLVVHDPPPYPKGLPTLEDAAALCRGKTLLFVDVKTPVAPRSLLAPLRGTDFLIASFYHPFVREVKRHARVRTVITVECRLVDPAAAIRAARADGIALEHKYLDSRLRGYDVYAWTINDVAEMKRVARLGAAVITDYPARALRAQEQYR